MADVITNQDLDKTKPSTPASGQTPAQTNAQSQGNSQIAQNYSGGQPQSSGAPAQNSATPAPAAAPAPAANPNQQRGSGYTNIQRIVGANQGNKLASTIGQNIQQAGQNAQSNIQNAQNTFNTQSNANRADTSQNSQLIQQALSDPTQFANDPNQISKFQNLLGGVYQGPQGLANSSQLKAQAQDVNQLGQSLGSAGGRQGLLQRFVGTPQYTQGQQTLDSLLLGASSGNDLNAARKSTMGIGKQEGQAENQAAQTAQEYAQRAQALGQNVQNQFGQNVSKQQQNLTQQAQTAQQARDAQFAGLQTQLGQGQLTSDIASQLGINKGDYSYGANASNFINENAQQANAQNAANSQQYAQMQALAKLGGQFAPTSAQQTLAQYQNPSQAGTFQAGKAYDVNAPAYQQAQQQGLQTYNDYVANTVNPNQQNVQNLQVAAGLAGGLLPGKNPYQSQLDNARQALANSQAQAGTLQGQKYNIADEDQS